MVGAAAEAGWRRFRFEIGTARNWYFLVPRGTREFAVRAAASHTTDRIDLEINAPDRTMAVLFGNRVEQVVPVPRGLDGKLWHVHLDLGGATTFDSRGPRPRFPSLDVTLDLKGLPGYLAPTGSNGSTQADPADGRRSGRRPPGEQGGAGQQSQAKEQADPFQQRRLPSSATTPVLKTRLDIAASRIARHAVSA